MPAVPPVLWTPSPDAWDRTRMGRFLTDISKRVGTPFGSYEEAWRWSIDQLDTFWGLLADHFDVRFRSPPTTLLDSHQLPGARWFVGAELNYAEQALSSIEGVALIGRSQTRSGDITLTAGELADQVARAAGGLRALGVESGDRVVAYLPNIPEAAVAMLACASIGAIWSSCPPEFGVRSVVDRFRQIEPKVLLCVNGYSHRGRRIDRSSELAEIQSQLPSLMSTVTIAYPDLDEAEFGWEQLLASPAELRFEPVPFDHPLYILFSSGTTGLPKPIIHGHGGITLEHLKILGLHHDLGPSDRFCWFSTTGWMMWNYNVSGLLVGATVVLFDGDPGFPDLNTLWRMASDLDLTMLGTSAGFLMSCLRARLSPGRHFDLTRLRSLGSTGSPLPPEGFRWVYDHVSPDLQLASASGGTDICTAFVAASPLVPVWEGEISCRCLGMAVDSFDPAGNPIVGELGDLVVTEPAPSMPVGFWNDPDGRAYRSAYFDHFPGVWRHGDWVEFTERGSCIITGRSDATLNRGGVRMGTAEFYSVVEAIPGVADSLVVHLTGESGEGELVLLVVPAEGAKLTEELKAEINRALRSQLSPRHAPDRILSIGSVPRTVSGKKMELPVKRLLQGEDLEQVANPGATANPESLAEIAMLIR
ncbi:MAG: acetoacetate--CoA ligase [Actinomycetota bacterium]